ncbi:MAG: tRNA-dihydrouridine synthase, partial [Oscillospiraceae bacterium]|nr:tRNA-dihydrouridine synthase [Oscillospiraceae bacterium]
MIKLGNLKIEGAALAPMAGFTDSAFRRTCAELGAGLLVSEMISAKALCFGDKKTAQLIAFSEGERPYALQL